MEKPTIINRETYLKALALFTLAHSHYQKMRDFEFELGNLLKCADEHGYGGVISDAIYEDGSANFDAALKKANFIVSKLKK